MLYNLIMTDWLRLYRYYDINGKLDSYVFILFNLRFHKGDSVGEISTHQFVSLYKYTRLTREASGKDVFKHVPLLEALLGTVEEHDGLIPKYTLTHTVGNVNYTLNIFERYSYFSNVGKWLTFNKKEVYQVISPIGDCLTETFAPPAWIKRPHPNVIINQAKAIKDLIDNFTLD